jgi:hypothetical protein
VMLVSAVLPVLLSPPREAHPDSATQSPDSLYSKNTGTGSPRPAH